MFPILLQCMDSLFKRLKIILALTIGIGVIWAVKEISFPTYRAEAVLVVTPLTSRGEMLPLVPKSLSPKAYDSLLRSDTAMNAVRKTLTDQGHFEQGSEPLLDDFRQDFSLAIEILDQTTRPIEYSPLIRLQATADSRELAKAMVNAWMTVAKDFASRTITRPVIASAERLAAELSTHEAGLEAIWDELAKEKAQYDIDALRKEIELLQERYDMIEGEEEKTARDLAGERTRLAAIQQGIANEKPYIDLEKAPSDDIYWQLKAESPASQIEDKAMRTQEVNQVYVRMKVEEQLSLGLVASHEAKLATLATQRDEAGARIKELIKNLGEHDVIQNRLTTREALAKTVYEEVGATEGYAAVLAGILRESVDAGVATIGVNALYDEPVTALQKGRFGRRGPVLGASLLMLLVSTLAFLAYDIGLPLLRQSLSSYMTKSS